MRVLTAVFPNPGGISFDVTNILRSFIKRRREQENQTFRLPDEMFIERGERRPGAFRISRAGNGGPRLRQRIDPGLCAFARPERSAIVEVSPPIPRSIPGGGVA